MIGFGRSKKRSGADFLSAAAAAKLLKTVGEEREKKRFPIGRDANFA